MIMYIARRRRGWRWAVGALLDRHGVTVALLDKELSGDLVSLEF